MVQVSTVGDEISAMVSGLSDDDSASRRKAIRGRRLSTSSLLASIDTYGDQLSSVLSSTVSGMIVTKLKVCRLSDSPFPHGAAPSGVHSGIIGLWPDSGIINPRWWRHRRWWTPW